MTRFPHLTLSTLTFCALTGVAPAAPPPTEFDELAVYSIDSDTNELTRYSFATDDFTVVGVVQTAAGEAITDCESLGFVPGGDAKGIYSVPTKGTFKNNLVRIDPLTAEAIVYAPTVVSGGSGGWSGDRKVTGLVPYYNSTNGKWYLLAASSEDQQSDKTRVETRELVQINPESGASSMVATQGMLGDGLRFESLGIDSRGHLFATSRTHFFRIHHDAGYWVENLGPTGLDKAEGFEVVFGDYQPSIDMPGVDSSWTQYGVFLATCDNTSMFGVLNPADGTFEEYLVNGSPSSFVMKDAEGLVVVTLRRDPLYGSVVGFD